VVVFVCGIIAYTGCREAVPLLLEGLRKLEYRGYDSAGLATIDAGRLHLRKCVGRVGALAELIQSQPAPGVQGVGHTRWATHGRATLANAHPQVGGLGDVAVVHNGLIENHRVLRRELKEKGYCFHSDTDTEVVAHLIADLFEGDLCETVRRALERVRGTYALAVVSSRAPGLVVGASLGMPLAIGIGAGETFLGSDPASWPESVTGLVHLEDSQVCGITAETWQILGGEHAYIRGHFRLDKHVLHDLDAPERGHATLEEIHEQPVVIEAALRGRLDESGSDLGLPRGLFEEMQRLVLVGCGTSYHAALLGKYLIESFARLPVEVDHASEFRYRDAVLGQEDVVVALSQSGETADILAALAEARQRGCRTLAVGNVPGSTAGRLADCFVELRAGPEVGVASTKAFAAQVVALTLLALQLGKGRLSANQVERVCAALQALPDQIRRTLDCQEWVRRLTLRFADARAVFFLGRKFLHPVALEGALKLKELAYLPAQGYPAGELKHGPLALVDAQTLSIFLMPRGPLSDRLLCNLEEVKARGGPVVAVASAEDEEVAAAADEVIIVPDVPDYLQPLVTVVPLQLLAYHAALLRGCDVDRPRNLAKCVTVE
jgi:glucosamine--fructose-6-phosphate aminotransferase (isomerizing)